jgi:nucleoid DNA-binding protein
MPAKKKSARRTAANVGKKAPTQAEVFRLLAERTELSKSDVRRVFDVLHELVGKNLAARGPGQFTIPGLCKLTVRIRPARKARKGISPFTGEPMMFKAKPASKAVRIRPTKALKNLVA